MANLAGVLKELQQERDRLNQAIAALAPLAGRNKSAVNAGGLNHSRRPLSAAARRRISLAQKARWAKRKARGGRVMSIAARRKIAAAQRARWAKLKKAA